MTRRKRAKKLRFGVVGISEGNGHPYSWSAIFNGYDRAQMASCPFPVIPQYLSERRFPQDAIRGAEVTHVWTQDRRLSEHIAKSARVPHVVRRLEDMVGAVDGVLLARDDAENHYRMSEPFLNAGLPVYIDKPIATGRAEMRRIFALGRKRGAKVFTCSAASYASEFTLSGAERAKIGRLRYVDAVAPKSWEKYAVHGIEPVLKLVGPQGAIRRSAVFGGAGARTLQVEWKSGLRAGFTTTGAASNPVTIRLFGEKGHKELVWTDAFGSFRGALRAFTSVARGQSAPPDEAFVGSVVEIIEKGLA